MSLTDTLSIDLTIPPAQVTLTSGSVTVTRLGVEDNVAPYTTSWDSLTATDGAHVLTVVATDLAGNSTVSASINVTVDNTAPVVSITEPPNLSTVSGIIVVSATASDNGALTGVQFMLDDAPLDAADTTSPYGIAWDTTGVVNGPHTLKAVATDAAGNQTTAQTITVDVQNP